MRMKLTDRLRKEKNDQYFEGVLQMRDYTEDQFNAVIDHIEESDCRITKFIEQPRGVDLFLFSQKFVVHMSNWLKDNFICQVSTTRTLHTRDKLTSRDLWRVTALVHFYKHRVGDILQYQGEDVKLMSIGTKLTAKNMKTGKRLFLDPKLLADDDNRQ